MDIENKEYLLNQAKKSNVNSNVIKKLDDLTDEACRLYAELWSNRINRCVYSYLLLDRALSRDHFSKKSDWKKFCSQSNREDSSLKKEFGISGNALRVKDDYPLIKGGIVSSIDELIKLMNLVAKKKTYLYLNIDDFRTFVVYHIVGKKKLIEMIENATDEQIKELADIEEEICRSSFKFLSHDELIYVGYTPILRCFLNSIQNTDVVKRVLNVVLERQSLKKNLADRSNEMYWFGEVDCYYVLSNFRRNNVQIDIESFEALFKEYQFGEGVDSDELVYTSDLSKIFERGFKLCSEDMNRNGKKINLRKIFDQVNYKIKLNGFNLNDMSDIAQFVNFVFVNIDKIQLDDTLIKNILFGNSKNQNFIDALSSENNKTIASKLEKIVIIIDNILAKQGLEYEKVSDMRQQFKEKCERAGRSVSCNRDDIFLIGEKLYLIDKNVRISQFNSVKEFFEYVYSNINTSEGERYADFLVRLFNDDFKTALNVYGNHIDYYSMCLASEIFESQNASESLNKLKNSFSWWNSVCIKVYMYVILPLIKRFQSQPSQPKIINIDKVPQSKEINGSEISTVPESENKNGIHKSAKSVIN